jgi:hypothetical protein
MESENPILFLKNNRRLVELWLWEKKKQLFETLATPIILYGREI